MNKLEVRKLIESNKMLNAFINSPDGQIEVLVRNVRIRIFKEDIGANYYYRLPYNAEYNYNEIADFMKLAVPVISELVEKRRTEKLQNSDF